LQDQSDVKLIKKIHERSPEYGYRRISIKTGFSNNKAYRLMKKAQIKSVIRKKKYNRYPAAKREQGIVADNLIKRDFNSNEFLKQLHCDISQINVKTGQPSYICGIIDVFNNELVAHHISKRCDTNLVLETLKMLKSNYPEVSLKEAIIHTDRGTQFTSKKWHLKLEELNLIPSMSPKGSPVDNSPIESFFSTLKAEFLYLNKPENVRDLHNTLTRWIAYYNNERIVTKLNDSPIEYRNKFD
jgi:transposase InsO family protein